MTDFPEIGFPRVTQVPKDYIHDPDKPRCGWVPKDDALYCAYHDLEWGRPIYDGKKLFSKLIQDGQQAGLAWITILRKRDNLLRAYDRFDPDIIAHYGEADRARLLGDKGIIRSKLKVNAAIHNAQVFIKMRDEALSLPGSCRPWVRRAGAVQVPWQEPDRVRHASSNRTANGQRVFGEWPGSRENR